MSLLKQRLQNGQIGTELPDQNVQSEPQVQNPTEDVSAENIVEPGSTGRYFGIFKRPYIFGSKPADFYNV